MKQSILRTKFHPPRISDNIVRRPRLYEKLSSDKSTVIDLISAPAGYGKSILMTELMARSEVPAAWLSLDEGDNDIRLFLQYFVTAINILYENTCRGLEGLIEAPNIPSSRILAGTFLNDLEEFPGPVKLILDDYHLIVEPEIHQFINELFRHPSPNFRLVMATRHDPPLSLNSWRASGLLQEIRYGDLAFLSGEISDFLNIRFGDVPDNASVDRIRDITEGWAVGLNLLVLVMIRQEKPVDFIRDIRGSFKEINNYFISEVLQNEPEDLRIRLLESSLADRFCGDMIDYLHDPTRDEGSTRLNGQETIRHFSENNFFVIELDEEGRWYHFHHQFQDLLKRELKDSFGSEYVEDLQRKLSIWFESQGLIDESIKHMLLTDKPIEVIDIISRNRLEVFDRDRWHVVQRWIRLLPPSLGEEHPALIINRTWILFYQFRLLEMVPLLEKLMSLGLEADNHPLLFGEISFFLGIMAYWQPDGESSRTHLSNALAAFPDSLQLFTGEAELYRGLAAGLCGEKEEAKRNYYQLKQANRENRGLFLSRISGGIIFSHLLAGEYRQARTEALSLEILTRKNDNPYTNAFSYYLMANAAFQLGDLDFAAEKFDEAIKNRYILHRQASLDAMSVQALIHKIAGRQDESERALALLTSFESELHDGESQTVLGCRARMAVQDNDFEKALRLLKPLPINPSYPEMFMWLEVPSLTKARCLVLSGSEEAIIRGLEILSVAEDISNSCYTVFHMVDIHLLRSIAHEKLGRHSSAMDSFRMALDLAASTGCIRPFLETENHIVQLVDEVRNDSVYGTVLQRIVPSGISEGKNPVSHSPSDAVSGGLLTNREFDVLELIAQRYSDKEIAAKLCISSETVRAHLKKIFQKLDVNTRRNAADTAIRMGLIQNI